MSQSGYAFPTSLVTQSDLRRLINELESVDGELVSRNIKNGVGLDQSDDLLLSRQLEDFLQLNQIDLGDPHGRSQLIAELRRAKDEAPVVHMTFATSASHDVLSELAGWVRSSIHPQAVMTIGLQPELIGGVFIRTTNKVFDFSIKSRLAEGRKVVVEELEAIGVGS